MSSNINSLYLSPGMVCLARQVSFSGMWPWPFLAATEKNAIPMRLPFTDGRELMAGAKSFQMKTHMSNTKEFSNLLHVIPSKIFTWKTLLCFWKSVPLHSKPGMNALHYFCTGIKTSFFKTEHDPLLELASMQTTD